MKKPWPKFSVGDSVVLNGQTFDQYEDINGVVTEVTWEPMEGIWEYEIDPGPSCYTANESDMRFPERPKKQRKLTKKEYAELMAIQERIAAGMVAEMEKCVELISTLQGLTRPEVKS